METKRVRKVKKGGKLPSITRSVIPYIPIAIQCIAVKNAFRVTIQAAHTIIVIAYFGNSGATVSLLTCLLYGVKDGSNYRAMQARLSVLLASGYVVSVGGRYSLTDKAYKMLSAVIVEGEGAKLLLDIERRQKLAEARKAKKLAKIQDAKNV
jgi:hypothetical protein